MSFRKTSCCGAMRGPAAVIADTYRWYYIAIVGEARLQDEDSVGRSPRPEAPQTPLVDHGDSNPIHTLLAVQDRKRLT